jgi:hypothetical protein
MTLPHGCTKKNTNHVETKSLDYGDLCFNQDKMIASIRYAKLLGRKSHTDRRGRQAVNGFVEEQVEEAFVGVHFETKPSISKHLIRGPVNRLEQSYE